MTGAKYIYKYTFVRLFLPSSTEKTCVKRETSQRERERETVPISSAKVGGIDQLVERERERKTPCSIPMAFNEVGLEFSSVSVRKRADVVYTEDEQSARAGC